MRKKIIMTLFAVSISAACLGGNRGKFRYSGYSGGMMLQTGYVSAGSITVNGGNGAFSQKMSGMPIGIGGAMKFHFGGWLRFGAEGYATTLRYGDHGSNARIGWGGVLADGIWRAGRFMPFAGVTVGGGSLKNLTLNDSPALDFEAENNVSFRKYPFVTVVPFIGIEYAATSHIHLVLKLDWMTNLSNPQPDFPKGPRIYLGFAFCRGK